MSRSVVILAKRSDGKAVRAAKELAAYLASMDVRAKDITASTGTVPASKLQDVAAGVSFGGDGTFLRLVDRLEEKDRFPLIGVNLGKLGFITTVGKNEARRAVREVLDGKCKEDRRQLIRIEVHRGGRVVFSGSFVNEAALLKDVASAMVELDFFVDGALLTHLRADGLIVSTPTGSTAHSLSAGGPLLHPCTDALLMVPVCGHSLFLKPCVFPSILSAEIRLKNTDPGTFIVLDGQKKFQVVSADNIRFVATQTYLRLFGASTLNWVEALHAKLGMT
jgi:NAD+ kinase